MKKTLISLLFLTASVSSYGQWSIESNVDAMSDEKRLSATIKNEAGYRIQLYRIKNNGPVWMNFEIPSSSTDMFSASRPLMYRIDKNKPYSVDLSGSLERLGFVSSEWNPKWVNFRIWHGDEKSGTSPILAELMRGSSLLFRYYISTGGSRDIIFSISGGEAEIMRALNIGSPPSIEQMDVEKELRRLSTENIKNCIRSKLGFAECSKKVIACSNNNSLNILDYNVCVNDL